MDDGSCGDHLTMTDCLAKRSYFDKSQSYCRWVDNTSTSDGESTLSECRYRHTHYDFKVRCLASFLPLLHLSYFFLDHDHDVSCGSDLHRSHQSID